MAWADAVDQLDDLLGGPVARRGLAGEDIGARDNRVRPVFGQAEILVQDVHDVEKLALVLMDALDLHIKERVRADGDPLRLFDERRQFFFVDLLDAGKLLLKTRVLGQRLQRRAACPDR